MFPKYANESENCGLFLHINEENLPPEIASIKLEYDLVWKHGGKQKYQHVMTPQFISRDRNYCGSQAFPSHKFQKVKGEMEWRIAIRVIEVNYYPRIMHIDDNIAVPLPGEHTNLNVIEMEREWNQMSKQELIALLRNVANHGNGEKLLLMLTGMQMSK